jgi:hypothetical protein
LAHVIDRRTGRRVYWPTPQEDAAITVAALSDPDNPPLTDEELAQMRPVWDFPDLVEALRKEGKLGRPPLPPEARKQRVTDPRECGAEKGLGPVERLFPHD